MSASNKTRLEVQTVIRSNIIECLRTLGHTGYDVMEFGQASFQKADKVVLMRLVANGRAGWQSRKFGYNSSGEFVRTDEYIDEQSWQISVIHKRKDTTTDSDVLAEDIADIMIAWFNGPGCDYFREHGMANLLIDRDSVLVYNDNSDLYQKRAVFTVKIQVPKEMTKNQDELSALIPEVKPV